MSPCIHSSEAAQRSEPTVDELYSTIADASSVSAALQLDNDRIEAANQYIDAYELEHHLAEVGALLLRAKERGIGRRMQYGGPLQNLHTVHLVNRIQRYEHSVDRQGVDSEHICHGFRHVRQRLLLRFHLNMIDFVPCLKFKQSLTIGLNLRI